MVPISMAGMKKNWLNSLRVMSNIKVFTTQDSRPAQHDYYTHPHDIHMVKKKKKKAF